MRKTLRYFRALVLIVSSLAVVPFAARAGELILLSSAVFQAGGNPSPAGIAADASGNIFITGDWYTSSWDSQYLCTVKYTSGLLCAGTTIYKFNNYPGTGKAVAVDADSNVFVCGEGNAFGTLIEKYSNDLQLISSVTVTGGGDPSSVAIDLNGNVFVACEYKTFKFNNDLAPLASVSGMNSGIATDPAGNVYLAGFDYFGFYLTKYDNNLATLLASWFMDNRYEYDESFYGSSLKSVAMDPSGNIIASGYINPGGGEFLGKFDSGLNLISSAAVSGINDRAGNSMIVDKAGNIIITGYVNGGGFSTDFATFVYDNKFSFLSSAVYNSVPYDWGTAPALDNDGNIVATGYSEAGSRTMCTFKYSGAPVISTVTPSSGYTWTDNTLTITGKHFFADTTVKVGDKSAAVELINSTTLRATLGPVETAGSMDVTVTNRDGQKTKFVNGFALNDQYALTGVSPAFAPLTGGTTIYLTGSGFTAGSTVTIGTAPATGVQVISWTKISCVVPPGISPGAKDLKVTLPDTTVLTLAAGLNYVLPLSVTAVSPASGPLAGGTTVYFTGESLLTGTTITFGGISAAAVAYISSTSLAAVTPAGESTGAKDIVVTNPAWQRVTLFGGFTYAAPVAALSNSTGTVIDPAAGGTAVISPESGNITVDIPGGTFTAAVTLTLSSATVPASSQDTIQVTNVGIEVSADGLQPSREITLTVYYRDADIAGLDESKLSLARYDSGRWIPIPTIVYADQNKLVGTIKHLSTFAVVQLAPAADLAGVKVYPNPFNPRNGNLTLANLTGEAEIKIYNVAGELVRTLPYTSANGQAAWDGKNDGGNAVASGVYLAFIKCSNGKKIIKIAVER